MDTSVGGLIQGISLGAFLQMVQMEKKTCTLTIRSSEGIGRLFIYNGDLVAAETDTQKNREAAYEIIGWDDTLIEIDDTCLKKKKEIDQPLMSILMEGLRVKDEKKEKASQKTAEQPAQEPSPQTVDSGHVEEVSVDSGTSEPEEGIGDLQMADEQITAAVTPAQEAASQSAGDIPITQIEDLPGIPVAGDDTASDPRGVLAQKRREAEALEKQERPMREAAAKAAAKKKKRLINLISIGAAAAVILAVVAFVALQKIQAKRTQEKYTLAITRYETTTLLEDKEDILLHFVENNPKHPEIATVQELLSEVQNEIETRDFKNTVRRVESLPMGEGYVEKAVSVYQAFLDKHPGSKHAEEARSRIASVPILLDHRDFAEIRKLHSADDSIKIKSYAQYLSKYPKGVHRKEVEALIAKMSEEYFTYLKNEIEECDQKEAWHQCILLCNDFATLFPKSRHIKELANDKKVMTDKQDYKGLQQKAAALSPDFAGAVGIYRSYLKKNPESYRVKEIHKDIAAYQKKQVEKENWEEVFALATNPSADIQKRMSAVRQYMRDTSTNTYMKDARALLGDLEKDRVRVAARQTEQQKRLQEQQSIARKQQEQKRIKAELKKFSAKLKTTSGRFTAMSADTVKDSKTSLLWTMLDSRQVTGKCITYREAQKYVRSLKSGGFSDWRMPRANELVVIYKNKPFFPSGGSPWYWTSDVYTKGYHQIADIVTSKGETAWKRDQKKTDQCGAVRAVRP